LKNYRNAVSERRLQRSANHRRRLRPPTGRTRSSRLNSTRFSGAGSAALSPE
jgi:hypothetical protein